MTAPRLSRYLVLEAPQNIADGGGGFSHAWVSLGSLWGDVVAGAGREVAGQEVIMSATAYRITVRAAPVGSTARPKAELRFRDGSRTFAILSVSEHDADARYLTCSVREEVPA